MIRGAIGALATSFGAVAAVFANPDMRRLQLAWGCSAVAMWSFAIALAVYAFGVGGAAAVGVAGLVRLLPGAFASPVAGLLGDRHSRRLVLLLSALGCAVILAGASVAVVLDAPAVVVIGSAGLFTVASSPYVPAEGALLPLVARTPQELSAANVAHGFVDNAGFILGSALTGLLLMTTGPEGAFLAAALASAAAAGLLASLGRDRRPSYVKGGQASGLLRETARGVGALWSDPQLRLVGAALTLLVFFTGAADVLIVVLAIDLLALGEGAVGYLNAGWGVGGILGGAALALLLDRGHLALGMLGGSLVVGAATVLPGVLAAPLVAYIAWIGIGAGYTFVEVTARTLLQRLGSDETLARALSVLESSRFVAGALGAIAAPLLVALFGVRGALFALGAVLPLFALLRWTALRSVEVGAPVDERAYALLRGNSIFAPLPVYALERLSHDLVPVGAQRGEEIISQGDRGDRFYLIESGEVEVLEDGVFRRSESEGESFGEIALLLDVPRTATVRATTDTRLLALDRHHFITAVTGHRRSDEAAGAVAHERLTGPAAPRPEPR